MPKRIIGTLEVFLVVLFVSFGLFADHLEVYFLNGIVPVPIRLLTPSIQGVIFLGVVVYFTFILFLHGNFRCFWNMVNPTLWLVCFLLISTIRYPADHPSTIDALNLLIGVSIGQALALFILDTKSKVETISRENFTCMTVISLLSGIVLGTLWPRHYGITYTYEGQPRWSGAWDNPNIFGLLMGTGVVLAASQIAGLRNWKIDIRRWRKKPETILYSVAMIICAFDLLRSCSRGAWLGTVIALAYLSIAVIRATTSPIPWLWSNRAPFCALALSLMALAFWQFRSLEWRSIQRLASMTNSGDFSWQNRVIAWRGTLQIITDYPWFGSGWGRAQLLYQNFYIPSKLDDGAAAETNDFLMLGATLGIPALISFGMYLWLSLTQKSESRIPNPASNPQHPELGQADWLKTTCRAGAIVLLVGFWFDGGLFQLATASTFWVLLELGNKQNENHELEGISEPY